MADVLHSELTESPPLNTEFETPTLEAATEHFEPSLEFTPTAASPAEQEVHPEEPTPGYQQPPVAQEESAAISAPATPEAAPELQHQSAVEPAQSTSEPPHQTHQEGAEAATPVSMPPASSGSRPIARQGQHENRRRGSSQPRPQSSQSAQAPPQARRPVPHTGEEPEMAGMEDFASMLESFDREQAAEAAIVAEGDNLMTGTVIKLTDKHVVIDVGLKSEGLIPIEQVLDSNGEPKLKPGDTVDVVIEREEPEGGYLASYDKAQRLRVWDVIEKAANDKTPVVGTVLGRVKGGLTVDIGIKAFLPGSQLEIRPVRNLDGYIGQQIEVRVIKLNKKRGNVVISRKEILEEEQNSRRFTTLEHLEEGSILTGTVKNLTDYGAFVDLGGIDGLLHITDMSWGRLTHPRDLVNVGDEIQVKVLKFDKDKQRVSLGFKQLTPDPWLDAVERYPVGAHVRGRILSVTDYGSFVELEQGIEGLVHVSEMTWSKRMKHPSKLVKHGDEVETVVLSVNPSDRRISLGMKQLLENPWENLSERYPTGAIVEGRVRNLTDFGAFIEIEDGIDGLVHVSNLSWTKRVKHPSEVLKKGEKVRAVVLGVEPENRRLSLGVKQLQPDVWETFFAQHRVGDVVKGKVLRTAQFGAFVEIAEGVEGLCHVSEAVDPLGQPIKLEQGQEHEFKIIKMNAEEKKVGLSIRAVGEEASRAEVESYKQPASSHSSSSSSSTTTLGDLMNWKRDQ